MPRRDEADEPPPRGTNPRVDDLLTDLGAQFDAARAEELAAEVQDRTRREVALVRLVDRLRAAVGRELSVATVGGQPPVGAVLADVGPDWVELVDRQGTHTLVALSAVTSITGLIGESAPPGAEGAVAARLDLAYALRRLTRSRSGVRLGLVDGATVTGTLDRVGADWVELAEHPPDEPRRREAVRRVRVLPIAGIARVSWS